MMMKPGLWPSDGLKKKKKHTKLYLILKEDR